MADKGKLAGQALIDHAAYAIVSTAQAQYPGRPRQAALCAMAAATVYGDTLDDGVAMARAVRKLLTGEPGGHVAANGVVVGRFGSHGSDSHQAARDVAAIEAGEL